MTWPTKTDFVDGDVLNASQMNNIGTNLNIFNPTSATNGQVWVADGSGSGAYQDSGGGFTLIQTINTTSGTRHTISSIPTTYRHLFVQALNTTVSGGAAGIGIELNGVTTSTYYYGLRYASSQPLVTTNAYDTSKMTSPNDQIRLSYTGVDSASTGQRQAWIYNYAATSTKYKSVYAFHTGLEQSTSRYWIYEALGFSQSTTNDAAITSVSLYANGATFTGGTFSIYGVK